MSKSSWSGAALMLAAACIAVAVAASEIRTETQNANSNTTQNSNSNQNANGDMHAGHDMASMSKEAKFAMEAAMGGMAEVEMGRLATQKASNDRVKQFGQKMVDDHSKANNDLKQAATQEGIELPADTSAKHKAAMQKLSGLSGAAFDKAYMDAMVKDHVTDVKEFEKASKAPGDSAVKKFAVSTLPTLKDHLQMARDLDNEVKGSASKSGASQKQKPAAGASKSY